MKPFSGAGSPEHDTSETQSNRYTNINTVDGDVMAHKNVFQIYAKFVSPKKLMALYFLEVRSNTGMRESLLE